MARILCVDDDVASSGLKRSILEQAGHRVDVTSSVQSATEMLKLLSFDAIVTDWRLGSDTAQSLIQVAKAEAETPVVVVSGFVAEAFQSNGPMADIYLDKPVNPAELLEVLHALLQERRP